MNMVHALLYFGLVLYWSFVIVYSSVALQRHFEGHVQERRNSSALAMQLRLFALPHRILWYGDMGRYFTLIHEDLLS